MTVTTVTAASSSVASIAASGSATLLSPAEAGVGGVFVAIALVVLLAFNDVLSAKEDTDPRIRRAVVLAIVPLLLTFTGIVLFESLQIVGVI